MEAVEPDNTEPLMPAFNTHCFNGMLALEKIMGEMTRNGTDIHELMSFISVVWASHAANIMRNYMHAIPPEEFRLGILEIADAMLQKFIAPANIPDRKDMQ